jgi:hypothetical protein
VAVTVAVIRMIEHENVVERGAADEVVSSSHSQSSLILVHSSPGPGAAGVGDAMKAADVCDAVLKTAVVAGTADVLDAAAPGMQRRAVSS